jgi:DNA-binding FrmR family transcriptional regulator
MSNLPRRLQTIVGHIRGVARMTEADAYCITIMHQVQAVQRAIDAFNTALLEAYLADTVTSTIRDAPEKERKQVIGELLAVFQRNEESKPVVPKAATSDREIK